MKLTEHHLVAWMVALGLLFASCSGQPEYLTSYSIEQSAWRVADTARLEWQVTDTTQRYDLALEIRHDVNYPFANLYLYVEVIGPDGTAIADTLDYPLCAPSGKWYGDGFGTNRTLTLPYRQAARFAQIGRYTFRVRQGMRRDPLPGIREVSLLAYKHRDGEE